MKKFISAFLALALTLSVVASLAIVPVSAATYKSGANSASSSYKNSIYYKNFQNVTLSGDQRTDVIAIAMSQVGYLEGNSNGAFSGTVAGSGNYTEYNYNMGDWGSGYTYEWCATFCSWALLQAGATNQNSMSAWCRKYKYTNSAYIWREVGCGHWADQLRYYGYFKYSKYHGGTYAPQTGDLIFYSWDAAASNEDHIGLVVYSDSNYVYTIEGNTSDQSGLVSAGGGVFFKKYALNYQYISGYGVLPYKTNSSAIKIDYSGAKPGLGYYVNPTAVKYLYTTETGTAYNTTIPRFSMFEVTEVCSNGRLKVKYTSGSTTYTGYVLNNTDRVVQITASAAAPEVKREVGQYKITGTVPLLSSASSSASTIVNVAVGKELSVTSVVDNLYGYTQYGDHKGYIKLDGAVTRTGANDFTRTATFTGSSLRYADNDFVVSWNDIPGAAGFSCKVIQLNGQPNPGNSDEANDGVVLYDNTTVVTQGTSFTIPAANIENGKYLKIAIRTTYPGATTWKSVYITPVAIPFADISPDSWMYGPIEYCYNEGLMNGVTPTKFDPNGNATMAMLVKTIHIIAGAPKASENAVMPYADAKPTSYYYEPLLWCVENGIIRTDETPTFSANATISREMAILYFYRMADRIGKNDKKLIDTAFDGYTDVDSISNECLVAMQWAVGKGLISGNNGALNPKGNANRAQLATLLSSVGQFVENTTEVYAPLSKGDLDNSGSVNTSDYINLKLYLKGTGSIYATLLEAADVDNDGFVSTIDYVALASMLKH